MEYCTAITVQCFVLKFAASMSKLYASLTECERACGFCATMWARNQQVVKEF